MYFDLIQIMVNSDSIDVFPPTLCKIDGDGYGDNLTGINGDAFPNDSTQYRDSDGDGYENYFDNGDLFPKTLNNGKIPTVMVMAII